MSNADLVLGVSDFVALLNQTLEFAYPSVVIVGELADFRVSKNRWVYFDLKDDFASVKFFGTIYQLPGPLEDGLSLRVKGTPRLHPLYGFSVTVSSIQPMGEGSIKKAATLLETKLRAEGLFEADRKRLLPYPPKSVGLITSLESAAYHDFIKILNQRWSGIDIRVSDVQVQGEAAVGQIVRAIEYFNQHATAPEVLVITRGGGKADDLAAYSSEQVTRAVSGSRIPTIVAIGHEVDISLAELAADQRASTPSNAAELLSPDKRTVSAELKQTSIRLSSLARAIVTLQQDYLVARYVDMTKSLDNILVQTTQRLNASHNLLMALGPKSVLRRGYAIVRKNGRVIKASKFVKPGDELIVELSDATIDVKTNEVKLK